MEVDKPYTYWNLSISMFSSPDSGKWVGNCTFTCGTLLGGINGTRPYSPFHAEGKVYKISSNKYKCKFEDPYSGDKSSIIIKLISDKKLKLSKTKSTKNLTGGMNPTGKYKLTKRYRS